MSIYNKYFIARFIIGLFILFTLPAYGHHGGAHEWQFGKRLGPVSGVVTKFAFRFPHIQIYFDVTDENGEVVPWAVTSRWTPTVFRKHGWNRNTIKPGDKINVIYFPHVSNPTVGTILRLEINDEFLETNFSVQ